MLKQFKAKHNSLLGIDLSPTSIKVLEISQYRDTICVEGYGYEALPANAFETSPGRVVSAIKRLLAKFNSSAKFAAIAMPDSTVISKTIQLVDSLNDLEMEELIFLEADKYLAYPPDKINIDFMVLGPNKKKLGMLDVLLLASREDEISKRIDILKDAGLETKIVDIKSYAIASVFEQFAIEINQSKLIAVLDISYESISLLVLENGKIIYTREDVFASRQFQETMASHDKLSNEEAILIQEQNLKSADYETEVIKPFINLAIQQIKRSMQYYLSTSQPAFIEKIFLTGELSQFTELVQKIQLETGFLICVANPFKQLSLSKKINEMELTKVAPLFLLALGLALRLAHDN